MKNFNENKNKAFCKNIGLIFRKNCKILIPEDSYSKQKHNSPFSSFQKLRQRMLRVCVQYI